MSFNRKAFTFACVLLTPLVLALALVLGVPQAPVDASSHREAPAISKDPSADNTDTYVWIPANQTETIVLAASWIPFESPEGGPNYWEWDDNVHYKIHVDNNGDAVADVVYILTSTTSVENGETFLYNTGPITTVNSANWNRKQRVSLVEIKGGMTSTLVNNQLTTPSHIGPKSTPDYAALEAEAIQMVQDNGDMIKVYAGQTDDPFWVDLQVFDLLTLRGQNAPIGYSTGANEPVDSLAGFNNHSLIIEVPISRLTQGNEPVLGVWATSSRKQMDGTFTQVSRLGMPLVNEAVLPLALKDAFNTIPPSVDVQLYTDQLDAAFGAPVGDLTQKSVEDPELGRLLCGLYDVPLPKDADDNCSSEVDLSAPGSGRTDIFDIFLRGMVLANPFTITTANGPVGLPAPFTVTRPSGVVPAEMIRINTAIKGDLCAPTPSRLGVLGQDACGFPNGRRPMDDVVEIELLAVAGAAYGVLTPNAEGFAFNADLIGVLDDGIDQNDQMFRSQFPYFAMAQSGRTHLHTNEPEMATSLSFGNITIDGGSAPWLHIFAALASVGIVGSLEWFRRQRKHEVESDS